ncbi:MAG: helix-turn-helix transcriptional regulator [Acidobacteriota bacterium]
MTKSTDSHERDRLLTIREAAKFLRVPKARLDQWRCKEIGPPYVKMGRSVLYRLSALREYVAAQEVKPTLNRRVA